MKEKPKATWKKVVARAQAYVEARNEYDARDTSNRLHDNESFAFERLCNAVKEYEEGI